MANPVWSWLRWVPVPGPDDPIPIPCQDDTIPITEAEFKAMASRSGANIVLWARYSAALEQLRAACVRPKPRYHTRGEAGPEVDDEIWRRDLAASARCVPELLVIGSTFVMPCHFPTGYRLSDNTETPGGNLDIHFFNRHRPLALKLVMALLNSPGGIYTTCRRQTLSKLAFCFVSACNHDAPFEYQLSYREFHNAAARAQNRLTRDWNGNPEQCLRDEHHHYFLLGFLFHTLSQGIIEVPRFELSLWAEGLSEQEVSELPLPFDDASSREEGEDSRWDRWLRRTNTRYCRREEIEGVEWLGQFTLGPHISSFDDFGYSFRDLAMRQARQDAHLARFPRLIRSLRFTVRPQEAGDEWMSISGTGTQDSREFTMEGQIRPTQSRATVTMDSPVMGRLLLEGRISPYGIVGFWCHDGQIGVQGFFWLFKEMYYFDDV
ncbi:hypothetical protein PG985_001642 [Apiospora marii]|uniref:uncharacterized protein n=1 Tax=Apiospora marii TaxID=335849 RepID=UPI00312F03FF